MFGIAPLVSGLGGTLLGIGQGLLEKNQSHKHDMEIRKLEIESQSKISNDQLQIAINQQLTAQSNVEIESEKTNQSYQDFATKTSCPYGMDSQYRLMRLSAFIVSTARPIITYLLGLATFLQYLVIGYLIVKVPNTSKDLMDMLLELAIGSHCAFDCALGYWFGVRTFQSNSRMQNLKKKV